MAKVNGESSTDAKTGSMEAGLDCRNGEAQGCGNLAVRQAIHVAHYHDGFIQWPQFVYRGLHQRMNFPFGIPLFESLRPVNHRASFVMPVCLEFWQVFFILDLFLCFAPAN